MMTDNEQQKIAKLQQILDEHGINGKVTTCTSGPRMTRYEICHAPKIKMKKLRKIKDHIQMKLQSLPIRILTPIPGRAEAGIEVPNRYPEIVALQEILDSEQWQNSTVSIPLAIGKNTVGEPVILDLDRAPHILLAGACGTGKSVCINSMIISMVKKFSTNELQFVMFDPKIVELDIFRNLPHLQMPIINDAEKFAAVLHRIADEMDKRLAMPSDEKLPRLVIIIDELVDLLTAENKIAVETDIARIAQKGRKVGIHLIIGTQCPEEIPVVILANIPTKLCFRVNTESDSELVLGETGAEELLGMGDVLMQAPLFTERVQGAWISEEEFEKIIEEIEMTNKEKQEIAEMQKEIEESQQDIEKMLKEMEGYEKIFTDAAQWLREKIEKDPVFGYQLPDDDEVMLKALKIVVIERNASTSYLQRKLKISYNRAAELLEAMEARGIVSPLADNGKREILADIPQKEAENQSE